MTRGRDGEPPAVRVLVCEDQALTAYRLGISLRKLGYDVVGHAPDGLEAVDLARLHHPDVILMDVNMPLLDGIAATERIMREAPTAIVMLTAYGDPQTVERALQAGAAGYLVKPLRDESLIAAITVALARSRQIRKAAELERERDRARQLALEAEREAERARRRAVELRGELAHEREVVRSLAESYLSHAPSVAGLEVATCYEPASLAEQVGGDFFDFIELPGNRLAVVIGDVCGKGIPAATYTAMARHMLRAYALEDAVPTRLLDRLNRALCRYMAPESYFLTLVYGVLDLETFRFRYAVAGHPPPVWYRPPQDQVEILPPTGGLLGLVEAWEWDEASIDLAPGDSLTLFTDGITEARRDGSLFGQEGVCTVLRSVEHHHAASIAEGVVEAARRDAGGVLRDDVAIVVVRRPDGPDDSEAAPGSERSQKRGDGNGSGAA